MRKLAIFGAVIAAAVALNVGSVSGVMAQGTAGKTIVENAIATKDLSTLVTAVKAAGLVDTLSGKGPFTVFAPTNAAFDKLPSGTVATLLKPESKAKLTKILTYHVVAGKVTSTDLVAALKKHHGKFSAKTVAGGSLSFSQTKAGDIFVRDSSGGKSQVTTADVASSNGVVHIINGVLLPK